MKKLFSILVLVLSFLNVSAQDLISFKLTRTGAFTAPDGSAFVVVPFEGKSAPELYNMVKNNIMSLYKDPKQVMTENEGQTITVRGKGDILWKTVTFLPRTFEGYYTIVFKFKDGRVRVDAPVVDDELTDAAGMLQYGESFKSCCKKLFTKDGKPFDKRAVKKISQTEDALNAPINSMLGLIQTNSTASEDDNW